ncbi:MAG: hypothetical protein WCC60_05950 [Ilumatobacteraceae bacterium]
MTNPQEVIAVEPRQPTDVGSWVEREDLVLSDDDGGAGRERDL